MKKEGFVYIWLDKKRRKFCVGSHLGNENDGYITSTGHMKSVYNKRPLDFKRKILKRIYGELKELQEAEQYYLDMIKDEELGKKYYNWKKTASGGNGNANKGKHKIAWNKGITHEMQELRRENKFCLLCDKPKLKKSQKGKKMSEETRKKMSKSRRRWMKNNPEKWEILMGILIESRKSRAFQSKEKKVNSYKKRSAWNKGISNPQARENGKRGAKKLSEKAKGRRIAIREDGSRYWVYPENKPPFGL